MLKVQVSATLKQLNLFLHGGRGLEPSCSPDRRATAEKKLISLKQANKDSPTFYAEFSRYTAILTGTIMRNALCYELKADLVSQESAVSPEGIPGFGAQIPYTN